MKAALILLDNAISREGDFADQGKELLIKSGFTADDCIKFDYFANGILPDYKEFNLLYLTGSRRDSWRDDEFNHKLMEYIRDLWEYNKGVDKNSQVKIVAVCFGHQIVSRALGFEVGVNELGWEIGPTLVHVSPEEKNKVKAKGFDIDHYVISMIHQDIVLPSKSSSGLWQEVEIFGSTDKCSIQSLYHSWLLSFQGHPEFSNEINKELVIRNHQNKIISDNLFNDAHDRCINLQQEGSTKLAAWISNFAL